MMQPVDIIIPSMNNFHYLNGCIRSLMNSRQAYPFRVILINNGAKGSCDMFKSDVVTVLEPGKNLGWEGALNLGLEHSQSEFVVVANDDIFVPLSSMNWIRMMLEQFSDPSVAAVGPSSNFVMGCQQIFTVPPTYIHPVQFLIGFCVMHRRSALEKIKEETGYFDYTGGDDLEVSIRYRKAGLQLICHNGIFIFHHGSITGYREQGGPNGWNSQTITDKAHKMIIRKHGFKWFMSLWETPKFNQFMDACAEDQEGDVIREWIGEVGTQNIIEVGCGGNKTLPEAIGVDRIPKGQPIPFVNQASVADVICDANGVLPFEDATVDVVIARHVIEHVVDTVGFLTELKRVLKPGGMLLLATPNQDVCDSIPMNSEHVHAWNPDALQKIMEFCGFQVTERLGFNNRISMMFRCVKVTEGPKYFNGSSVTVEGKLSPEETDRLLLEIST